MSRISHGTFVLRESRSLSSSGGLLVQSTSRLFNSRNVRTRSVPSALDAESLAPLPDSDPGLDAVTVSNVLSEILGQSGVAPNRESVRRFSGDYLKTLPPGYRRPVRPNKRKRRSVCKHSGSRSFDGDSPKLPRGKPDDNCRKPRE